MSYSTGTHWEEKHLYLTGFVGYLKKNYITMYRVPVGWVSRGCWGYKVVVGSGGSMSFVLPRKIKNFNK